MIDRIAIISDIHGNIPALDRALKDIEERGIKRIFCLGDLAGKGPSSAEVVDKIRCTCEKTVKGNWDYLMTEEEDPRLLWHQKKLGKERLDYLKELPLYQEFYMSGKLVRLCHASPHNLFNRTYLDTPMDKRLELFKETETLSLESDVIGYGDIHGAHVDNFDGKTIFNAGSVGNPLELTQSSYAIIEGKYESREEAPFMISLVRLPYNIERAVYEAQISDMPDKEAYIKELRTAIYRGKET